MKTKQTIKTHSESDLARVGGFAYAIKHAFKKYEAEIHADGWAYIDDAKFAPGTFDVVKNSSTSP